LALHEQRDDTLEKNTTSTAGVAGASGPSFRGLFALEPGFAEAAAGI